MNKALKLSAMVIVTSALAATLSVSALTWTIGDSTGPVDLGMAFAMFGWLAFFHLAVFMVPLTIKLEPQPSGMQWLYYAVPVGIALIWSALDGLRNPVIHALAALIGLASALCWIGMLRLLRPWKTADA